MPLRLPYTTLDHKRRYYRLSRYIAKNAAHVVTVSENSKRDIVNLLGNPIKRTRQFNDNGDVYTRQIQYLERVYSLGVRFRF